MKTQTVMVSQNKTHKMEMVNKMYHRTEPVPAHAYKQQNLNLTLPKRVASQLYTLGKSLKEKSGVEHGNEITLAICHLVSEKARY